jgi:hypothetical protein
MALIVAVLSLFAMAAHADTIKCRPEAGRICPPETLTATQPAPSAAAAASANSTKKPGQAKKSSVQAPAVIAEPPKCKPEAGRICPPEELTVKKTAPTTTISPVQPPPKCKPENGFICPPDATLAPTATKK